MRAILGLYDQPPTHEYTDWCATQTDLDGIPNASIRVDDVRHPSGVGKLVLGRCADREHRDQDVQKLDENGRIIEEKDHSPVLRTTEFRAAPQADPAFATVDSSDGEFAWGLLEDAFGGILYGAAIDVDSLVTTLDGYDAKIAMYGWENTPETGTVYHTVDDDLRAHIRDSRLIQVGYDYYDGGQHIRGVATASGYVALHEPDWPTNRFVDWLATEIVPHLYRPDETDETDSETTSLEAFSQ